MYWGKIEILGRVATCELAPSKKAPTSKSKSKPFRLCPYSKMQCINPINQPMVDCCLRKAAERGDTHYGHAYRAAAEALAAAEVSVFHCTRAQLRALTATFDISPRITVEGFAEDYRFTYPKGVCRNAANQSLYDTLIAQAKWCYRRPPNHHEQCGQFNEMAAQLMLLENPLVTHPDRNQFISASGPVVKNFVEEFTANPRQRPSIRVGGELSRWRGPSLQNAENEDVYNHLYCYAVNRIEYWPAWEEVAACPERIHLNKNRQLMPRFPELSDATRRQIMEALL